MSDTDMLYMASLQKQLEAAEEKNAVLKKDIAERDVYITMAEQRLKELEPRIAELEDKHWNECRQIAHYEDELKKAKELLRETLPILHRAFFANYKDTNAANELYDKIKAVVGGEY